jgi:hypothetical protein
VARATTDKEGRFKLTNVTAGRYYQTSLAAAYFAPSEDRIAPGRIVTFQKGEDLEGVELNLIPGGVITGRVITAGGYPVIGHEIYVRFTDPRPMRNPQRRRPAKRPGTPQVARNCGAKQGRRKSRSNCKPASASRITCCATCRVIEAETP